MEQNPSGATVHQKKSPRPRLPTPFDPIPLYSMRLERSGPWFARSQDDGPPHPSFIAFLARYQKLRAVQTTDKLGGFLASWRKAATIDQQQQPQQQQLSSSGGLHLIKNSDEGFVVVTTRRDRDLCDRAILVRRLSSLLFRSTPNSLDVALAPDFQSRLPSPM